MGYGDGPRGTLQAYPDVYARGAVDYVPWLGTGDDADAGPCFVPGDLDQCNGPQTCTAPGVCDAPDLPDGTCPLFMGVRVANAPALGQARCDGD